MRTIVIVALAAGLFACSGCATVTGTLTGAVTNAVDCPAENYRANQERFDSVPSLHSLNALVLGPIGFVSGPVFGFGKGLSLDIQWVIGQVNYGDVFGTYGPTSIWRPFTFTWPVKTKAKAATA
jgi:hypothetical protein